MSIPALKRHRRWLTAAAASVVLVSSGIAIGTTPAQAAAPVSLSGAHWLWYPEGAPATGAPIGDRYFRKTFTAPSGTISEAQLVLTGDDTVDVWLNGTPIAGSTRATDSWKQGLYLDLQSALVVGGSNTLAIVARNTSASPAGLIGRVRIVGSSTLDLITDGSWKASQTSPAGWEQPGFNDGGWPTAADLGAYGMAPWNSDVIAPENTSASGLGVASATTEHRVNPLGVDAAKPRFGWKLSSAAPQRQGAYQVIVASTSALAGSNTGDVWDSGRVASATSVDVEYAGPALMTLRRYFWRVRVWDTQGRAGAWSGTQNFEMGLRAPGSEWQGAFIGQPVTSAGLTGSSWIWYPEGDPIAGLPPMTRFFRKTFSLASAPAGGSLVVTGDDTADVWVNGTQVSTSVRATDSWKQASVVDLSGRLRSGTNSIAISSQNTTQSPTGVIAQLTIPGFATVNTDASWKASQTNPSGWEQPGYNDSGWVAARALVTYGSGPWGANVLIGKVSPLVRKTFAVSKPVASARLLTTALGLHETRLNGAKVGSDVLAPGWTDYTKRLQYKVYDVTSQIQQGNNALGAWLGNGWFSGSLGMAGSQRYGTQPYYAAQLHLTFTDGTTSVVKTDSTWKTAAGPIRADDLYMGETVDARRAVTGWDSASFNDAAWGAVTVRTGTLPALVSQVDPGVTVQQQFTPIAVTQPQAGVWIFDMGQNFTGWNRLRVTGDAGTTVTMRHGEILNANGTLYTANLRVAGLATDRFTLAGTGGEEVFEPRFTVHGYRYVELTGFPGTPTASTVTGQAAWTSGSQLGTLTTSNAMLNQVQKAIVWGQRSNMLSIPTDCPNRDERLGWTGDIASFAATSTFNVDVAGFLDKFTDDLTDAQLANGAFTDTAPYVCCGAGTAGWGDAGVIVPYTLWQRYGDIAVVRDHFSNMTRWVDYLRSTAAADLIRDQGGYGDWLNVNDDTARNIISTAFFAHAARLVSEMAAATGHPSEATTYGNLANQIAAAFTSRFVSGDGTVAGNTQTGYVLALAFGLLPANLVGPAVNKLVAKVAASGGHLTVGFLGVENLLPVLADNGRADIAYQILLQPGFPGWGYMLSRGATTIWERWDGIRTDGSLNDVGMNSFNHYGLGSVGDFLYKQVGGLAPGSPGYKSLVVAPKVGGGLTSAKSAYETPYGQAVSDWTSSGGTLTLRVTIPVGTSAIVKVPASSAAAVTAPAQAVSFGYAAGAAVYHLPSGSYTFTTPA
ncbi:alpha-L-rhamnosidase [Allocatelliglobosispora scoriae]|uniref:alpha-L-rhamnosidase n=1 Tax=Allocatelliglobosispora scoriae TaxID=643052 RepID=A0A841BM52_9ACTN|nr:family 78 glycoside hydrolase catalytic domain [Allocatelliglobosispora scoriae]MBB5867900.1 alpha-L-rhamnosidase [Allocatelliglobosispora scoriae]